MRALATSSRPRRVVLVAGEFLGYPKCGGLGTATTFLAISLARAGHRVEILCARIGAGEPIEEAWRRIYDTEGVRIRRLEPADGVEPLVLALPAAVLGELRADAPEVAIVQDWGGPAYAALAMRELGLALPDTLFVVYCHGTRRWIAEAHGKLPDSLDSVAMSAIERAAVELADAVVSPSGYMLDWMRGQGWALPDVARAIPLLTESAALGTVTTSPRGAAPISKIVFFGRLEERKGVRPFVEALAGMDSDRLRRLEVVFLGQTTERWSPESIASLLPDGVRASFRTTLARPEALAELRRPGTLAVIPSLDDNSPNTVYECLEAGVPFIASDVGGIPELIAEVEHTRVLFEPSAPKLREALERALDSDLPFPPVRASFDPEGAARAWEEMVQLDPDPRPAEPVDPTPITEIVAGGGTSGDGPGWVAGAREAEGEWVLLMRAGDAPHANLVDVLARAQVASGADAVTCGIAAPAGGGGGRLFLGGRAGGLGLLENAFGTVGLVRRSLVLSEGRELPAGEDPSWPFYARLVAAGARVVSVPELLVTGPIPRGTLRDGSPDALDVLRAYEAALPSELRSLASVTIASALGSGDRATPGFGKRARHVWRQEGPSGFVRRAVGRVASAIRSR